MSAAVERSGLIIADVEILRLHYAETLRAWRQRFLANWDKAAAIHDERFCRMWEFYLAASETAFRYQDLVVFQVQLAKRIEALPITRDYMYKAERTILSTKARTAPAWPASDAARRWDPGRRSLARMRDGTMGAGHPRIDPACKFGPSPPTSPHVASRRAFGTREGSLTRCVVVELCVYTRHSLQFSHRRSRCGELVNAAPGQGIGRM